LPIFEKHKIMSDKKEATQYHFIFKPVDAAHRSLIHAWAKQEHIQEWLHGDGLRGTLKDLDAFLQRQSDFQHWIAFDGTTPFGYLITSTINKNPDDADDIARWCQREGTSITLDVFICDPSYLGKGYGSKMIHEFLISQFPHVQEVLIDPEVKNKRAVHVYEKAGFRIVGEFIAKWHPVAHYMMHLDMSRIM
jgi:RimJ/RimL family protein N-acetyltransferase